MVTQFHRGTAELTPLFIKKEGRVIGLQKNAESHLYIGDEIDMGDGITHMRRSVVIAIREIISDAAAEIITRDPLGKDFTIAYSLKDPLFPFLHCKSIHHVSSIYDPDRAIQHVLGDIIKVRNTHVPLRDPARWPRAHIIRFLMQESIITDPSEDLIEAVVSNGTRIIFPYRDLILNITELDYRVEQSWQQRRCNQKESS